MLTLRTYQQQLVDSVIQSIDNGNKDILVIAPTSAGKTICFMRIAEELVKNSDDGVVLILSHLGLLTDQTTAKFKKFSTVKTGILQAGNYPAIDAKVIIGTMQSLCDFNKASYITSVMNKKVIALIVDESHRIHSQSYEEIFSFFPCAPVIGFTGTPFRHRKLATGRYDDVAYQIALQDLIDQKYVVPPILKQVPFDDDTPEKRCAIMLRTYAEYERGKKAICFLKNKAECKILSDAFNNMNISACVVTADVTGKKRDEIFDRYSNGDIDILISVSVLEAGFDAPLCSVVMMMGTENPTSYLQRIGRALRPQDALSVKDEHWKQSATIYVYGSTPLIESGEYEKHHDMAIKPKKKNECVNNEELLEYLKDNEITDTDEYHHCKEAVLVKKIANRLNMPLIASMLNAREIDPQFLGRLSDSINTCKSPSDKPASMEHRKALIMALVNNPDISISDYSKVTENEAKALYNLATGKNLSTLGKNPAHILTEGLHRGKHVSDVPWAYRSIILKKAPQSNTAKTIRSFLKSSSQPK